MSRPLSRARAVALALMAVTLAGLLPVQGAPTSQPAPEFTLEPLGGKPVRLADFKGSPIVLLFWAPW